MLWLLYWGLRDKNKSQSHPRVETEPVHLTRADTWERPVPRARQGREGGNGLSLDGKVLGSGFLPHEVKFDISKQCLLSVYYVLGTVLSPWGAFLIKPYFLGFCY